MLMGLASYSVNFFHSLCHFLLEPLGLSLYRVLGHPGPMAYWVLIAAFRLVTPASAALIYRWVEYPSMQRLRAGALVTGQRLVGGTP
jgi:peptidoglycan/LPS O-acetylase OafA/YrhL